MWAGGGKDYSRLGHRSVRVWPQGRPACREAGCHTKADTASPRGASDHHPPGPMQALFRYFSSGPSITL